jgi:hypothetical protein
VRRLRAVDEHEFEWRSDLLEQKVGRQARVAGVVVKLEHRALRAGSKTRPSGILRPR